MTKKSFWTPDKIELLKAYSENPKLTKREIARKLKTSETTIDHAQRRYDIKHAFIHESNQIKSDNMGNYQNIITYLKDNLSKVQAYPDIKLSPVKRGDTLNIQITDWHVGRLVKNEYGKIIYDVNTFKSMIEQFSKELLKLVDKYISKGTPIQNVNILSTGDICDGLGIFATQNTVSEFAPPFQVMIATESIQKLILSFLERNLTVHFYGVKGNHGEIRINGKNTDPNANWDLMLYLMLDFWAKNIVKSPKIQIFYSELDYLNFSNRGWNYHMRHIAPNQSETSAGKAKFLGWAKQHKFDVLIYGHYHHWGAWDRSKITILRGGALTAGDEFAETLAEESEPIQLIWGSNESRPVTFLYPLDLGTKGHQK